MTAVANHGDANLCVVGELSLLTTLGRVHCDLKTGAHGVELFALASISHTKTRSKGIHVEEGVLPVLNIGHGGSIERLVTSVANCG